MSARSKIVDGLVTLFENIDGATPYNKYINPNNIRNRQIFWDEVNDYPFICVYAGQETREYQASGFKWGHLLVYIKIYTNSETPQEDLELIIEDIEYVLDENNEFTYDNVRNKQAQDIRINQITTDEGVLHPIGVGEILIQIRYDL